EKTGYCNTNTDYFVVARDEGAPIFSITSTKNAYQAVGQSFNVSGKAKDSGGNIKIYSSADGTYDSADTLISTIANKTDEQDWSASIAIPSGTTQGSTLYYIAIDLYGQTSIDDFPYKVDPAAPTFTITQLGSNTTSSEMPTKEKLFTSYAQKSSLFIVKGLVDDEGDSGLEDVIYYMVSSTEPAKITGGAAYDTTKGTWNKSTILRQSDGNHWTANLDFSSYDEGTSYTVYLAARDNARNISLLADNPCNKIILTPDGTAPVVGNAVADDDKITNVDINNDVKITASTITEVGSGIASVVLYENGSSIGAMTTSDSGATYTYSIPANSTHLSTGSHTFAVRATDKVGNISADKTIVIAVDTTNPTANISTVTPLTSAGYANGNVTVYATAGDEIELSEISWKVVDGTSVTKKEGTIAVDANDKIYKSFTFALDTREITTTSGTYTLTVTSTDKAENTTTTSGTTLNIDQATDVPVITLDSPATYEPSATVGVGTNLFKSSDSMTGTITDDDGLASIVIKIDTIVTDTIDGGGAKTYALSKSLSALAEGTHTIEVTATDNALGVSKTTNSFSVGIDNGAPTLALSANVTTTKNNIYYANGDLTITAVVKDGYKLGSLEWADTAVTPATGSVTVVQDSTSQTKTITVAKPVANVKSTRTITAKDSFGRTTADTITYDFDVTPPTLTPAALTGVNTDGDLNYFNSSKTLTITGTASDGTATSNDSGLDSVYYAIVEGHYATPTDATTAGKTVTWNLTSGSATWSAKVDLIEKADGNYTVFIKAVDFVGNEKISDAIKLVADKTSPAIAVTTINGVADTSVDTYYNKDTTIVGSLTEANLKQISVSSATCSGTEKTVTVENVSGVLTLSTLTDEGVWAITLSAEDKAGNKGSYTINTTVDKTSPAPVINEANTLAVGGKTFTSSDTSGSWFNQTSLQFIGYYKENGSGIEECSYFLNPATVPTTENVAGLTSNGTFSPASVTGDACKFNVTIANFSVENSGTNTIYFVVKDKAGNYSISSGYIIKVDQDLPNLIREIPSTSTLLSNCATAPAISGTCSDASSGVKSVVVKINGTPISSSITSGSWTATSSEVESVLKPLATSSYPVTAVVTDNAGNSNTVSLFTLTVDKTAPTAAISASIPTSSLNGKKSLSGTVTEDNSPASFTLYYSTSNTDAAAGSEGTIPTSWTKFGDEISDSALIYNWTLGSFDFSENSGTKTDGKADIYLLPVVYDKAGNCNVHADGKTTADFTQCSKKSVKYSVDQNTDRPVIKLSNLSISNSTLMSKTVIGTISDDDGISDFYYTDNSTSAATFATTDTNWKKVTVTDGSWSIEAGKDGSKTWWFYVKDTADGTFLTSNSNSVLTIPYISDSTTKADNSSSLDFKVDTSSPVINNLYVSSDNSTWSNVAGNVFGGTKTNIYAKVNVTEEVGMPTDETKAVSISINGESITLTDSTISSSGANPYEYVLGAIPLSSVSATGTVPLSVTVTDGSGLSTSKTLNISIDNTAPELSITYPSSSDWTTGKVTVKGIASDSGSSVSSVKYLIPTKTQQSATDDSLKTSTTWVTLTNPLAWSIEFNSSAYTNVPSGKLSLEYYATAKESESLLYGTIADSENHPEQCTVPIYFLLEDTTGNVALNRDNKLNVDTEGGKPTCTITYPDENAKTSGVVTIYGTATDDENVSEVRINSIKISTKESPSAETASDWTDVTYNAISASEVVSTGTVTGDSSSWYIKATGTKSWKVAFKSSGLSESDIKAILVSVQSYDENASTCTEQTRLVYIDKNVPKIQTLSLVQFASTPTLVTDTPNVSRTYVSGMYLSKNVGNGSWYLYGEITDDTSVKAITISSETDASVKLAFKSESTGAIESGVDSKIYKFLIPVTTTSDGHIYSKLSLDDGQHTDIDSYISIYIDSTAPSMYDTSNDKQNFTAANISALRLTSSSANVSDTNVVENSNSVYTFGDSIYEADSGLSCIAFYFERPASTTFNTKNRVYSPMYNSSDNNITPVADSASDGSVYINSEGLPALYKTGTKRSSTKTIEYSGLGSNLNIRAGGLVKIGGSYCLISSISGDVATIDTDVSESITTTEFIYAQVVNHKVTEGPTDNDYTTVQNDDADGMIESLHQTGTSYSWTASVFSNNIKDGPIQIHAVAIDNAGNTNHAYVSTSVQNNRPRIAKVMLGTDINGNGTYDYFSSDSTGPVNDLTDDATASGTQYGEFSYYSTLDLAGKSQSTSTLNPVSGIDTFVVKNGMCVIPDFTSGNGDLKYTYMVSDSSAAAVKTTAADRDSKDGAITALTSKATLTDETTPIVANRSSSSGLIADQISSKGGLTISTDTLKTYESWVGESKATKYFAFTFWDATEETTQGTDSLWALLKVPVIVNVVDDVAPKATINPFHWTSWSDCSTSVDSSGNPEGHIDLGAQPGVAGKVVIDGAAYDETRLGSISMTTPGTGETHEVAKYESGTWSTVKTSWPDNWEDFEITSEEEPSQSGHTVTWKFTVDMTKYGVVKDQVVEVAANDASTAISGGNASALSSDQTTTASPSSYYKMDFVPYIKGISGAYRSRLGRYPVQAGSNMVIEGYNFA
ncbi:MAG: Ig-like domain-containing protein, partial [Treponema sp.]